MNGIRTQQIPMPADDSSVWYKGFFKLEYICRFKLNVLLLFYRKSSYGLQNCIVFFRRVLPSFQFFLFKRSVFIIKCERFIVQAHRRSFFNTIYIFLAQKNYMHQIPHKLLGKWVNKKIYPVGPKISRT